MVRFVGNILSGIAGIFSGGPDTAAPSAVPTVAPTPNPSYVPPVSAPAESQGLSSEALFVHATMEQGLPCFFEMEMKCLTCDSTQKIHPCMGRPFEMHFRFTGDSCDSSRNTLMEDDYYYNCADFNFHDEEEEEDANDARYIIVTALKDDVIYYEGWVEVGDVFELANGGERFPADQLMTVYRSDDTSDPSNVVQQLQYHTSCSRDLVIGDTFGSIELVAFANEDQGYVSAVVDQTVEIIVSAPEDDLGDVQILAIESIEDDAPFFYDVPRAKGMRLIAMEDFVEWFKIPTDLSERKTYDLRAAILISNDKTGQRCQGEATTSFTVGGAAPVIPAPAPTLRDKDDYYAYAPTPTPSTAPTSTTPPYYENPLRTMPPYTHYYPTDYYHYPTETPSTAAPHNYYDYPSEAPYMHYYPTGDYHYPTEAPYKSELCLLNTTIECATADGGSCDDLSFSAPDASICRDRAGPFALEFLVTGYPCGYSGYSGDSTDCWDVDENARMFSEPQLYVQAHDMEGKEVFNSAVALGDRLRLRGPFQYGDYLTVFISSGRYGYPEELFQVIERLYLGCNGDWDDLTLNRDYGALQLVSFATPSQGRQSFFQNFIFTITIWNLSSDTIKLTDAQASTPYSPYPRNLTHCPIGLGPGAWLATKMDVPINLAAVAGWGGFGIDAFIGAQGQEFSECSDYVWFHQEVFIEPPPNTPSPTGLPTCYHVPSPAEEPTPGESPSEAPCGEIVDESPPIRPLPPQAEFEIRDIVRRVAPYGGREWSFDEDSYQPKAIEWLEDNLFSYGLSDERIQQRYALACIYFATYAVRTTYTVLEPRGWIDATGWLGEGDECYWFGITCDYNSMVETINLASNRITGSFPNEIVILAPSLISLDLFRNSVHNSGDEGHAWLGKLYNLKHLYYGQTNFEYEGIPTQIAALPNLVEYDCSYTLYMGPIEGWVFDGLENLEYLNLSGNGFNAGLPPGIGSIPNLQFFYAQNSFITGGFSFMFPMPNIIEMWVDSNPGLGGPIPPEIGSLQTLQSLSLSKCGLTGTIPTEVGNLRNLYTLWLYNNALTGTVPIEIGSLFKLQTLELEENNLTGVMPMDVCLNRVPLGLMATLEADCATGEIQCDCCTCCSACSP